MAEYMSKELFLASMGLRGDETKYSNTDAEHQHRSYSTYMSYEIMDCVEDSEVEDVVAVCRCKDCRNSMLWRKPNDTVIGECLIRKMHSEDEEFCQVGADDFCSYGKRRTDDG